jgi:predicted Fe-Mo cluster-binding NifX family protein
MTVAAFSCWKDRIAPVLDTAREFHIVEIRAGKTVRETRESLADTQPLRTVLRMAELQLDVLVCGAISRNIQDLIAAYGIRVVPFVSGELRQVIEAWLEGNLEKDAFAMPGCGFQKHRRRRQGAGGGMRRGQHRSGPR